MPDSLIGQASLLSELANAVLEPKMAQAGIGAGTFEILSAIQGAGVGVSQAQVARRLGITPPSLTEALKHVTLGGWVEQVQSPRDQRTKHLKLTRKGKAALATSLSAIAKLETEMVAGIERSELHAALAVLRSANIRLAQLARTTN